MQHFQHVYEELRSYIGALPVIDTHEHTAVYKSEKYPDYLKTTVNTYARMDLHSAGMTVDMLAKVMDTSLPVMERWLLCEPYWKACRNTGYIRMHERAARELYGVDEISRDTILHISERFAAKDAEQSYAEGLERCNILCGVVDSDMACDRRYLRPAFRMEEFVERIEIKAVRKMLGASIHTFIDWLDACDELIRRYCEAGAVAFKTTIATDRTLNIGYGSYAEAEESFIRSLREDNNYLPPTPAYQEFMFRHVLSRVQKRGLPVQMHTGMAAGYGNIIPNGNPMQLCPLFMEYPDMDFVIMHMGYPYQLKIGSLGKMFRNVYPDMSWAYLLSPNGAKAALSEWLDSVPATKIMGFGGDCGHEDHVYAHLQTAKDIVSQVLAQKVAEGQYDISHAKWIAEQLFLMNPYRVFRLEKAGVMLKK